MPEIDVDELDVQRAKGAPVFDVREPDEYVEGHVPGAQLIPLATVPDHIGSFPAGKPVYIVCASGNRSKRAAEYLRANGIDAVNVAGGTKAWRAAGKPCAKGQDGN